MQYFCRATPAPESSIAFAEASDATLTSFNFNFFLTSFNFFSYQILSSLLLLGATPKSIPPPMFILHTDL